ncbi:MAG: hypothetical protein KJP25_06145 [Gammaproteobacteria bacterium]|nr:hypothetical protein [Gammaproteobacteria bacterium]NNL11145.1 hypothetical protein [Pseudomonadales bacterium]NNM11611.1 hypothetical protein [Pseudomonadales bacterium]
MSSAPYLHDGSLETLNDVMAHYMQRAHTFELNTNAAQTTAQKQTHAVRQLQLTPQEQRALIAFLLALSN